MNFKKWKPKCSLAIWDEYGHVFKVTTKHLGIFLDGIIPFTWGLITLFICKVFGIVELFKIPISARLHRFFSRIETKINNFVVAYF